MFSGIIEETGIVSETDSGGNGMRCTIRGTAVHEGLNEGESVAVNGVCLTATNVSADCFAVDISPETLRVTTLNALKSGSLVNLERAMRLDQRIGGHLVSGHVDGIGGIVERHEIGNSVVFRISMNQVMFRHCIVKGSVAVDGVSLTINQIVGDIFDVSVIPHTTQMTTFGFKHAGDSVNIETDMIGKYIERLYEFSAH